MNNEQRDILIDRYLKGDLDRGERLHFEDLLSQDSQLREDLRLQQIALLVGDRLSQKELSNKFRVWDSEMGTPPPRKFPWIKRYTTSILLVATTIVIAAYLIYNWSFGEYIKNEIKSKEIYSTPPTPTVPIATNPPPLATNTPMLPKPTPSLFTPNSLKNRRLLALNYMDVKIDALNYRDNNPKDSSFLIEKKVILLLKNKDYKAALNLVSNCSDPNNKILFKGISMFYLEHYSDATALFSQWKIVSDESQLADQYIVLSCICSQQKPDLECIRLLKEMAKDSTANIPWGLFIQNLED